jgi:hypothetical protein
MLHLFFQLAQLFLYLHVINFFTQKQKHVLQSVMRRKRRTLRKQATATAYPLYAKGSRKYL